MSAPETNALPPAPTSSTTFTATSSRRIVKAVPSASHISSDIALRLSGLLKVIVPTASLGRHQNLAVSQRGLGGVRRGGGHARCSSCA